MKVNNSVMKNMIYLLHILWQQNKKPFMTMIIHIICGVMAPFIAVMVPSVIISLLMQKADMATFMSISALLLVAYGILQGSLSYFIEYNGFAFISLRSNYFVEMVYLSRAHLDLAILEDDANKAILEDAISAVESNIRGLEGMYHDFIKFMIAFLGLLLYAFTSGGLSIWLVLGLFALVLLQYFFFTKARKYEFSHREELSNLMVRERYLNHIAYDIAAAKDIRLFQLQDWIDDKFHHINRLITNIKSKDYSMYMLVDSISLILDFFRDIICYGYLIYRLTQGMPVDQFVFYLGIITGFSVWFKEVGESFARLSTNNELVNRMLTALDIKNEMHHGDGEKIKGKGIMIEFDHVSFHYPNQDRLILDDVSFTLHNGEKIALVGVNGAGKTTIVKLILGFYKASSGSIRINGIDICNLDLEDYYQHITGIFQDSIMMSYTIAENVAMNDLSDCDLKRVKECLIQADLWNDVKVMEKQELTYVFKDVQKDGIQLSGGQQQKLFMARALYRSFDCLLLDEPTAAMDAIAEKEMYENYQKLIKDKTSLFISHRLSSTRFCDHILVLDHGKIVERGNHEDLMALNGIYTNMFYVQSKYYEKEGGMHEVLDRT